MGTNANQAKYMANQAMYKKNMLSVPSHKVR